MKYLIGCNYWDSVHGTDMWRFYDEEVIRKDVAALAACGVKCMRVFPNWRDFQPVKRLYGIRMSPVDCVTMEENPLPDRTGIDQSQIRNFRNFAAICEEYNIQLVVAVMTGWMSGRLFAPPIVDGKNPVTDPEALMWTAKFIKGFVAGVKDLPNIVMWDLGNECNCMGEARTRFEAYTWTAFVRNAIKAEDPTRPISSGMHGLTIEDNGIWSISDQGEITDYLTTHPYPSPTITNDFDPVNQMRTTIYPTAQCMLYQDLGQKPVIMQEQGSFSDTTANREMSGDFARVNIYSCIAHNVKGYFWWCAHEHLHLSQAPYSWSMMERSLGMLDLDLTPKPVGEEMRKASEVIEGLPFENLPEHEKDAVCVLTKNDRWPNAAASFTLAKQAGLDVKFVNGDVNDIDLPDALLYLVPGVTQWAIMYKHIWDALKEKVAENGATMLVTYNGGSLVELEDVFGIRSNGTIRTRGTHTAAFAFENLTYQVDRELLIEPITARVLAVNETSNPVFTVNNYGKGKVYFLNMPLEMNLSGKANAFHETSWYKIYQQAAEDVLDKKLLFSANPQIGVTLHKEQDDRYIAIAINYSEKRQYTEFKLQEGWQLTPIRGLTDTIDKCDAAFYQLCRVAQVPQE